MLVKARLFVLTSVARSVYAHLTKETKSNTWCFLLIFVCIACVSIAATWLKRSKCLTCESPDTNPHAPRVLLPDMRDETRGALPSWAATSRRAGQRSRTAARH